MAQVPVSPLTAPRQTPNATGTWLSVAARDRSMVLHWQVQPLPMLLHFLAVNGLRLKKRRVYWGGDKGCNRGCKQMEGAGWGQSGALECKLVIFVLIRSL